MVPRREVHIHNIGLNTPISDVVTAKQQAVWSIMADITKIRINDVNVVNFGNMIEHTL